MLWVVVVSLLLVAGLLVVLLPAQVLPSLVGNLTADAIWLAVTLVLVDQLIKNHEKQRVENFAADVFGVPLNRLIGVFGILTKAAEASEESLVAALNAHAKALIDIARRMPAYTHIYARDLEPRISLALITLYQEVETISLPLSMGDPKQAVTAFHRSAAMLEDVLGALREDNVLRRAMRKQRKFMRDLTLLDVPDPRKVDAFMKLLWPDYSPEDLIEQPQWWQVWKRRRPRPMP